METKILRLLIVDPSPDDTELTLAALRQSGVLLKPHRVHDLAGLHAALEKGGWDAVLSERSLAHFGASAVLDILRRAKLDIPLIVLTHAIPDAEIAGIMRAGARDVILKNHLVRLLPALERELAVAAERAQHRAAVQALQEIESKHRAVVDGAREAICYSHDGMHIDANKAYLDMFEYENVAELEGVPVMNLIEKDDHPRFKQYMRKSGAAGAPPEEFNAVRKGGARFPVEVVVSTVSHKGETCNQIVVTDVSKRKAAETKLQYLNQHDPLTGLYNRHYFVQALDRAMASRKGDDIERGLLYLDFPGLRQASRSVGHAAVDRFMLAATRQLRETLGSGATLARYGDHEFTALIDQATPARLSELKTAAEKALKQLPLGRDDAAVRCECRIATARIERETESAQKLMTALYASLEAAPAGPAAAAATRAGPTAATAPPAAAGAPAAPKAGRTAAKAAAPPPAKPAAPARTEPGPAAAPKPVLAPAAKTGGGEWPQRIQAALEHEAFRLIYQPIVHLHGDAGEYFEVLVRIVADDGKLIAAGQFMPQAEASGQAAAIDRWVVKHSIRALAELHRQDRKVTFFINLSSAGLRDVELVVIAQQALHETRLKGEHVVFEIDEAALTAHAEAAAAFMRAAQKIGCSFCIDNFGRTLGSAARLREPPIAYLKLDAALAQGVAKDAVAQASLKAILEVAKAMEKKTIAKSIESADSLSALWTLGVDYVQGHYFQEADAGLDYEFAGETTISSESSPNWAVASSGKSR